MLLAKLDVRMPEVKDVRMSVQVGAKAATEAAASKKPSECIADCLDDLASMWSKTRSFLLAHIACHRVIVHAISIRISKQKYEKRRNKSRSPLQSGDAGFLSSCCCFLKYALLFKRPSMTRRASEASPNFRHACIWMCLDNMARSSRQSAMHVEDFLAALPNACGRLHRLLGSHMDRHYNDVLHLRRPDIQVG
ncbi:uncharacterized protein LOC119311491 [Triticum dicoccoides]|uniref:uncharacterized protein LOC119311491 n=1 Tax=Triticum dicoccoides TaxID=85692 RepID=UPI000E7BECE3|nr:uncharacterized protein LOC119311491 [Triticum dicoccoides]